MAYDPAPAPDDYAQPYGFDANALVNYLIQIGQPGLISSLPSLGLGGLDLAGGLAPLAEDLGTTSATNYAQDLIQMAFDPYVGGISGIGGFAPGSFESTYTYNPVDQPGRRQLETLSLNTDSVEGYIARELLDGKTPLQIRSALTKLIDQWKDTDPAEIPPEIANIIDQIPHNYFTDEQTGIITDRGPDLDKIEGVANDLNSLAAEDPQPGVNAAIVDPNTGAIITPERTLQYDANGNLVEVEEHPSELAQKYRDAGIPLPTEEFTPDYLMGADWAQMRDAYEATYGNPEVRQQVIDEELARRSDILGASDLLGGGMALPGSDAVSRRLGRAVGEEPMAPYPGADAVARQLMPYMFPDQADQVGRAVQQIGGVLGGGGHGELLSGTPFWATDEPPPTDPYGNAVPDSGGVSYGDNILRPTTDRLEAGGPPQMAASDAVNMVKYLLAGQGGDWLYNQQMGLQGSSPPQAPTPNVGPQTTQPAFTQAMLNQLVGGGTASTGTPLPIIGTGLPFDYGGQAVNTITGAAGPQPGTQDWLNFYGLGAGNLSGTPPVQLEPQATAPEFTTASLEALVNPSPTLPNGLLAPQPGTSAYAEQNTNQTGEDTTPWFRRPQEAMLRFIMDNGEAIWNEQEQGRRRRRRVDDEAAARASAENRWNDRMLKQRRQVYNEEYGYNLARSRALREAGITPTSLALAQRNQVLAQAGLRP